MPISVRLPSRVEQKLSDYCYKASAGFRGSDKTVGDVARHSKRMLRERCAPTILCTQRPTFS